MEINFIKILKIVLKNKIIFIKILKLADANFSSVIEDVHPGSKGAKTHTIYFDFKNGDGGKIACIEPDKEMRKKIIMMRSKLEYHQKN